MVLSACVGRTAAARSSTRYLALASGAPRVHAHRALHSLARPVASTSSLVKPSAAVPSTRRSASALSPAGDAVPSSSLFAPLDTFERRHVGPRPADIEKMLEVVGYPTMDSFVDAVVPGSIRLGEEAVSSTGSNAIKALSEQELLMRAKELGAKNKVLTSFIGMGYHQAVSSASVVVCRVRRAMG